MGPVWATGNERGSIACRFNLIHLVTPLLTEVDNLLHSPPSPSSLGALGTLIEWEWVS